MKRVISKLFPKLYLFIALTKREVYEEYRVLKLNNQCSVSFLRYLTNYLIHGSTPVEFNVLGFKHLNRLGKSNFITMRRNKEIKKYNDPAATEILCAKEKFNEYFSDCIKRKWIYISQETTTEQIEDFYNSLQEKKFIIKPNALYYGLGIRIGTTIQELHDLKVIEQGGVIVEEIIKNDESIAVLNPSSLNTIRVVTVIDSKKHPHIVTMVLRTGNKGSIIDNARGGGSFYHIDKEVGIIDIPGHDSLCNSYCLHPSSNIVMPGYKIPRFNEIKEYCLNLASRLPGARFVGWDIAITTDGIEVIEGNHGPSAELIQCNGIGLYKIVKQYLND